MYLRVQVRMRDVCAGAYVRMRAYSTLFEKSQDNFAEKIFKFFVDTFYRIVYHVIVR